MNVRVPGLQAFSADTNFTFQASDNHGTADRSLQPDVFRSISAAWGAYRGEPNTTHPMTGGRFGVSAMALENGGMSDIAGRWSWLPAGHQQHKDGIDIDFNNDAVESNDRPTPSSLSPRTKMRNICRAQYFRVTPTDSFPLDCQFHTNHFHLSAVPESERGRVLPWRKVQ